MVFYSSGENSYSQIISVFICSTQVSLLLIGSIVSIQFTLIVTLMFNISLVCINNGVIAQCKVVIILILDKCSAAQRRFFHCSTLLVEYSAKW